MMAWWAAPLSGAAEHSLAPWAAWHGRAMVLAWGVLLPLGALAARYFKVTPRQRWPHELDNRAWWHAHRSLQWLGVGVLSAGTVLAWGRGSSDGSLLAWAHGAGGWLLLGLAWVQIGGALLRGSKGGPTEPSLRGDHYDMTPRRRQFERLHKALGWLALGLAMAVLPAGLVLADAPRWMLLVIGSWWLLLGLLAWRWQRQGRCVDTYQAIWGPDMRHPGNRLAPIGWGVCRPNRGPSGQHHG